MIGMKAGIKLGLVTFVAAAAIGGESQLRREGSFWVEVEKGSERVSPRGNIRVSTIGDVTVKGVNGPELSYVLVKRVKAVSEDEARRLLNHVHARIAYFEVVGETTFWVAEGGVSVVKLLKFGGSSGRTPGPYSESLSCPDACNNASRIRSEDNR